MSSVPSGTGHGDDILPERLLERALAIREDSSLHGLEFCGAYTSAVDSWVAALFDAVVGAGEPAEGLALVAVGGHGRGELCPQSDLDLLLLGRNGADLDSVAERLWYPMWDAKFRVGHGARTVAETLELAGDDLETSTALITARHLAGDEALSQALIEAAQAQRERKARVWTKRILAAYAQRRTASGEVAHELEPELKEGAGGLRDAHFLDWIRALGGPTQSPGEPAVAEAYGRLLAARIELHRVTGRPGDRLALQEQEAVAEKLGYDGGVQLMRVLSRSARELAFAADAVARRAGAKRARLGRGGERILRDDPDLGGTIVLAATEVRLAPGGESDPTAPLRLAVVAAERGLPMAPESVDRLASAPALSDPWPANARRMLVRVLMSGTGCTEVIEALDRSGVWERLIPEWAGVSCKPQRNPYHRWNVDRHLTETVARAASLVGRVSRPDLLLVGALLHDIGKNDAGGGGDGRRHLAPYGV
jgi:[protein-PII] uridylyltransferase